MKKVLIAYFSLTGKTAQMATYIAEGVRFTGNQATVKKISEIKSNVDLEGYDGYIFGSPTFSLDVPNPMNKFMSLISKSILKGKLAGSFGTYRHEVSYEPAGVAADMILKTMKNKFNMEPFELGSLKLKDVVVDDIEGMRACQDYGKVFDEKLG